VTAPVPDPDPGQGLAGAAATGAVAAPSGLARIARSAWPVRVAWLAVPLGLGPAAAEALDAASRPVQLVASVGAWAGWLAVLVAALVPTTLSLTIVRVGGPAAAAAGVAALVAAGPSAATLVGTAVGVVAALACLAPDTAEAFVDGSSYGDERRLPLRCPGALLLGPVELAWLAVVAGAAAGPLLLAARQWLAGALALAVGLPLAWRACRSLHALSRRWLVFVPAGLVVHDPFTLAEPALLPRRTIRSLAPGDRGAPGVVDLTAGAGGLALVATLVEPMGVLRAAPRRAPTELVDADALAVTPSRPGRVLAEARRRRIG
jgi:hypothetical protein